MQYRGKVTAVTAAGVYVLVPPLHPTQPFGPLTVQGAAPSVDDIVVCLNVGDETLPDLVVLNAYAAFSPAAPALTHVGLIWVDADATA